MAADDLPDLRASDADREQIADQLRHAAGEGRLTVEELDERLNAAYAARTHGELAGLTTDIVAPGSTQPAPTGLAPPAPRRLRVVPGGDAGTKWVVSVMGGSDRTGRWRVGREIAVVNVMGGADIDLNDAELASERTVLTVFSLMGGSTLYVPDGLNVEVSEFSVMGGNGIKLGDAHPDPGGPTVHVRLWSIMGGTDLRRGRRKSWSERKEERRQRKLHGGSGGDLPEGR